MASFVPRMVFPTLDSLPRSYFLGHHRAGLNKMKNMLIYIDLVIECRDYRVPLTSRNPLFEENLAGQERLIVYTKLDLGSERKQQDRNVRRLRALLSTRDTASMAISANTSCVYRERIPFSNGTSRPRSSSPTTKTKALYAKS